MNELEVLTNSYFESINYIFISVEHKSDISNITAGHQEKKSLLVISREKFIGIHIIILLKY